MIHQPTAAHDDHVARLTARLTAADQIWADQHGHPPADPAYLGHLARAAARVAPGSSQITGPVAGSVVQARDIIGGNVIL